MKFLFDLFPVILFFAVFKWGESDPATAQALVENYLSLMVADGGAQAKHAPILLATAVAILATLGQVLYLFARGKKIEPMLWISLAIITVFGGATIYFNSEAFIKWKPTVLYWALAAAMLIAQSLFGKNPIRAMMEKQITLPDAIWPRLSLAWALFFLLLGVLNLFVAYQFSTAIWVNFKLFGVTGLMFAFIVAQSFFLSKYVKEPKAGEAE
jgi:intracellular septation protein